MTRARPGLGIVRGTRQAIAYGGEELWGNAEGKRNKKVDERKERHDDMVVKRRAALWSYD